ncbi:hypothetical protein V8F06_007539 [Rhypophila decipiens]
MPRHIAVFPFLHQLYMAPFSASSCARQNGFWRKPSGSEGHQLEENTCRASIKIGRNVTWHVPNCRPYFSASSRMAGSFLVYGIEWGCSAVILSSYLTPSLVACLSQNPHLRRWILDSKLGSHHAPSLLQSFQADHPQWGRSARPWLPPDLIQRESPPVPLLLFDSETYLSCTTKSTSHLASCSPRKTNHRSVCVTLLTFFDIAFHSGYVQSVFRLTSAPNS